MSLHIIFYTQYRSSSGFNWLQLLYEYYYTDLEYNYIVILFINIIIDCKIVKNTRSVRRFIQCIW